MQKPHCDPPVATKRRGEAVADSGIETVDGRDRAAVDARDRGDARDVWLAVDQHRAAAALTLRRAAVLHREHTEALAEHREERLAGRRCRPRPAGRRT